MYEVVEEVMAFFLLGKRKIFPSLKFPVYKGRLEARQCVGK
jgi:hypothetical protein